MSKKSPNRRATAAKTPAARGKSRVAVPDGAARQAVDTAIATDLAPAAAIALLAKTEPPADGAPPALEALAAGASPSDDDAKVRVQVVFENGSVLPIEMSKAAGSKLSKGLADALGDDAARPA